MYNSYNKLLYKILVQNKFGAYSFYLMVILVISTLFLYHFFIHKPFYNYDFLFMRQILRLQFFYKPFYINDFIIHKPFTFTIFYS